MFLNNSSTTVNIEETDKLPCVPLSASPPLFLKVTVVRLGIVERTFVDTGATMTLIRVSLVRPLLNSLINDLKPAFITADGRRAEM